MFLMTLAGLLVVAEPASVSAQSIDRLSAETQFAPNPLTPAPEIFTKLAPTPGGGGGKVVYRKTVFVNYDGALFVTFYGTADEDTSTTSFNILMMTCLVDGVVCQAGGGQDFGSGPAGWVPLQNINPNLLDNNISYSWCTTVQKGPRTVELKLARYGGDPDGRVFYERAHIYIDAVKRTTGGSLCVPAALVPGSNVPD